MAQTFRNKKNYPLGTGTLNTAINATDLTIVLSSGHGANFPSASFTVTIDEEIILIDSRSTDTLTVNSSGRAFDGTTASAHGVGSTVANYQIVKDFTDIEACLTGAASVSNFWLDDDADLWFGADKDIRVRYDEAGDDRLEFHDGTNLLAYLTDAGTTGNFGVTGSLLANTIAVHSGTTATVYNASATTVNAFQAGTTITMGATSGSMTLRNPTITLAPGAATTTLNQTGIQLVFQQSNAGATLIDFYPNPTDGTSNALSRFNRLTNTSGTKQTLWYSGDGTTKLSFALTASTSAPLIQLYNGNATVNVTMAGSSGDITTAGDIAVNGGDLTSSSSTFNLLASPTTVNAFAGASTAVNIGHASGLITLLGDQALGSASTDTCTMTSRLLVRSVTDAGPMTATPGTQREIVFNTSDSKFYGCTVTHGTAATWVAFH